MSTLEKNILKAPIPELHNIDRLISSLETWIIALVIMQDHTKQK